MKISIIRPICTVQFYQRPIILSFHSEPKTVIWWWWRSQIECIDDSIDAGKRIGCRDWWRRISRLDNRLRRPWHTRSRQKSHGQHMEIPIRPIAGKQFADVHAKSFIVPSPRCRWTQLWLWNGFMRPMYLSVSSYVARQSSKQAFRQDVQTLLSE